MYARMHIAAYLARRRKTNHQIAQERRNFAANAQKVMFVGGRKTIRVNVLERLNLAGFEVFRNFHFTICNFHTCF